MTESNKASQITAFRTEHQSLENEIEEWRTWWNELREIGLPHFGEMGDRLAHFRNHLAEHFTHEETQGCLSVVLQLPEETVKEMARLRDEHGRLLEKLDQLIYRLHACESEFECWTAARDEFQSFLDELDRHETAEDKLLDKLL